MSPKKISTTLISLVDCGRQAAAISFTIIILYNHSVCKVDDESDGADPGLDRAVELVAVMADLPEIPDRLPLF